MNDKYARWYLGGVICLFVSGTLAAKSVFLVDNELESKTESRLEHWQLDRQSLRKYADRFKKITTEYIWPPASGQTDRPTRSLARQA
jgi:hypothetical protein